MRDGTWHPAGRGDISVVPAEPNGIHRPPEPDRPHGTCAAHGQSIVVPIAALRQFINITPHSIAGPSSFPATTITIISLLPISPSPFYPLTNPCLASSSITSLRPPPRDDEGGRVRDSHAFIIHHPAPSLRSSGTFAKLRSKTYLQISTIISMQFFYLDA